MTMKKLFIISAIFLCLGCKKNFTPIIQKEFLESDWIIPDSAYVFIEDSSIITLNSYVDRLYSYKYRLSNDSIIVRPNYLNSYRKDYEGIFRILELTSNRLIVEYIKGSKELFLFKPGKKFLFVKDSIIGNNKIIKSLELSSWECNGFSPFDLKLGADSILSIRYYNEYAKYYGFFQHKLTPKEFERIAQKFNRIYFLPPNTDYTFNHSLSTYSIIVNTRDSLIYTDDSSCDFRFFIFIHYLRNIQRVLEFSKADSFSIQCDHNRKFFLKTRNNYAP